jgi:hypothetical protein
MFKAQSRRKHDITSLEYDEIVIRAVLRIYQ